MTNEELVTEIQRGDTAKLSVLWEQVERLVAWKTNKVLLALGDNAKVEFDDLYNSGYIALVEAVNSYKPNEAGFTTWFMFYLKKAFAEATGYRRAGQKDDAIHYADSLDAPLGANTEGLTLGSTIPDPGDLEEETVDRVYQQQLHDALERALGSIDDLQSQVIRLRFYDEKSSQEIAEITGLSPQSVNSTQRTGLTNLRKPMIRKDLESYIELRTDYFLRVAAKSQKSPVELVVERREEMYSRFVRIIESKKTG